MFHGDHCPACRATYPVFSEASRKGVGIVSFGHVDCSKSLFTCRRFQISSIPTFYSFNPDGESKYSTFMRRTASSFIKDSLSFLPDFTVPVNSSWIDLKNNPESKNINAVILLTTRWSFPVEWKTLAFNFSDSPILFGKSNERKTKKELTKVIAENPEQSLDLNSIKKTDLILFVKNGKISEYKGNFTFRHLQREIYEVFDIEKPVFKKPIEKVKTKFDFNTMCSNKPRYCVIDASTHKRNQEKFGKSVREYEMNNVVEKLSTKYADQPFRFTICGDSCPSNLMKDGYVYIFHRAEHQMIEIKVDGLEDKDMEQIVSKALDEVISNNASWKPSVFSTSHEL